MDNLTLECMKTTKSEIVVCAECGGKGEIDNGIYPIVCSACDLRGVLIKETTTTYKPLPEQFRKETPND